MPISVPQHLDAIFSVYVYVSGGFRLLHLYFLMLLFRMVWRLTSGSRRIHLRVYVALRSFDLYKPTQLPPPRSRPNTISQACGVTVFGLISKLLQCSSHMGGVGSANANPVPESCLSPSRNELHHRHETIQSCGVLVCCDVWIDLHDE